MAAYRGLSLASLDMGMVGAATRLGIDAVLL
jgi:hypothetical protein